MKRRLIFCFVGVLVLSGAAYLLILFLPTDSQPIEVESVIQQVQNNKESTARADELTVPRLVIPSVGISAHIQNVGIDSDGNMAVPTSTKEVGWYEDGAEIGAEGNAVIAGHVSSWRGPIMFAKLRDLNKGDDVHVLTSDNRVLNFKVTDKQSYAVDDAPLDKIFGYTDKKMVNLITCEGGWNILQQTFSHRLVVFTEYVGEDTW